MGLSDDELLANATTAQELLEKYLGEAALYRDDRDAVIAQLSKRGWSNYRIAKALGLSQPQVARILLRVDA